MAKYSLKSYAPSLSEKADAEKIRQQISALDPQNNIVEIDFEDIVAMTTICARLIFGQLYLDLGPELYNKNIKIIHCEETLEIIIRWGIESALEHEV